MIGYSFKPQFIRIFPMAIQETVIVQDKKKANYKRHTGTNLTQILCDSSSAQLLTAGSQEADSSAFQSYKGINNYVTFKTVHPMKKL